MLDTRTPKALLASLGLLSAVAIVPAAALAQETAPTTPPAEGQAQPENFDDETIEAFATAAVSIEEIRETYIQRFEGAETEEQRLEISQEANEQMVAAVEETPGISVEEYNSIVETAAVDSELADRINEEMANPPL